MLQVRDCRVTVSEDFCKDLGSLWRGCEEMNEPIRPHDIDAKGDWGAQDVYESNKKWIIWFSISILFWKRNEKDL